MKKRYEKPQVYMEKFELAEHIAGCNLTLLARNPNECKAAGTVDDEYSESWFVESNTNCGPIAEGYCYTNSSINVATINS